MLTEKEAWTKIAERLEDPHYKMLTGLCFEVYKLCIVEKMLDRGLADKMAKKSVQWARSISNSSYAYPLGQNKVERAAQARIFASECEP